MRIPSIGGGAWGQFHALFVPEAVETAALPAALCDAVMARLPGQGHKWYVAEDTPDGLFTAVDYTSESGEAEPPVRLLHLALWDQDAAGVYHPVAEVAARVRFDEPFGYVAVSRIRPDATASRPSSALGGWAWDRRVSRVAGYTPEGQRIDSKVINGCWLVLPPDAGCQWRQLRGLDKRNQTIYGRNVSGADQ